MTRSHLPSGTTHGLDFLIPDTWSADQALAVVELLDDLRERICTHYQLALHELQREQRSKVTSRFAWSATALITLAASRLRRRSNTCGGKGLMPSLPLLRFFDSTTRASSG